MQKKKLLYIGHTYHDKTQSTSFLLEELRKKYDVQVVPFDPYHDDINTHFIPLNGKSFDVICLFQIMPSLSHLKEHITFKKSVFFPMYDDLPGRNDPIWQEYQNTQIISFCRTLHNELKSIGFSSHYIQYFPKPPSQINNMGDEKSVFFWQRISSINVHTVEKLLKRKHVHHLHIHKALDPKHTFTEPSTDFKWKINYSKWFATKEEMLKTMEKSAIYITPRFYEGIGMSFIEAMARGRCVIAPDHPTMNEYIKHGKTGYLYNPKKIKPIRVNNIRKIQKNTLKFIQNGFTKWEKEKSEIVNWIEEPPSIDQKKIDAHFRTRAITTLYELFSFLPIVKIKREPNKTNIKILGISTWKIKRNSEDSKIRHYIFGIPVLKILKK